MSAQEEPFRHRRRVRRMPPVNKTDLIGFTNYRWPQAEEAVLKEITDKDQTAISMVCIKYNLNPADFCDKWLKLLRTFTPEGLLDLLKRCKEGHKAGLSFPDIGKTVRLRRGSVKNILKGHVNLDNIICPRASHIIGVPDCFSMSLFQRPNLITEQVVKEGTVQQFVFFREMQMNMWLGDDSRLMIPRAKQILLMKHLATYGVQQLPAACCFLHISESVFDQLWGLMMGMYGPVRLFALAKIVVQLLLMGYPAPTITYRLSLEENTVRDISLNFCIEDGDQEQLLTSFFHLIQVEQDLKTLCESCNMPVECAKRLKERFVRTQELSKATEDRSPWWLYQNGLDVALIEAWMQRPFEKAYFCFHLFSLLTWNSSPSSVTSFTSPPSVHTTPHSSYSLSSLLRSSSLPAWFLLRLGNDSHSAY